MKDKPKGYKFFPESGHTKSVLDFMNESISDFHSSKGTGNKYTGFGPATFPSSKIRSMDFAIHDSPLGKGYPSCDKTYSALLGTKPVEGGTDYPFGAPGFTPVFSGVRVTQSLAFCIAFCRPLFIHLSFLFCPFVCLSSIYSFWLPLLHLQAILKQQYCFQLWMGLSINRDMPAILKTFNW